MTKTEIQDVFKSNVIPAVFSKAEINSELIY